MDQRLKLIFSLELIWWIFTALVIYLVLSPIPEAFNGYRYLGINILFIVIFITYARHIFLLKHSLIAYNFYIKFALIFISFPLVFYLVSSLTGIQTFVDENGYLALLKYLNNPPVGAVAKNTSIYIKNELMFLGTCAIVTAVLFPFRLIISIWRVKNNTGV